MATPNFPTRRWAFGLNDMSRNDRMSLVALKDVEPMGQLEPRDEGRVAKAEVSRDKKKEFVEKKAWEVATGPGKQFLMTGFMMWMMGSGVHIMSIIFTVYQLITPLKGMLSLGAVFKSLAEPAKELGVDLTLQKLVFIAIQLGVLLFITHRFSSMGLLPTSASDWLGIVPIKTPTEFSTGGVSMIYR